MSGFIQYKQRNSIRGLWENRIKPLAKGLRKKLTPAEAAIWSKVRKNQVDGFHFRRQHPVGSYILDFFCPAAQLGIEIDGAGHSLPETQNYDSARREYIEQSGVKLLRFSNQDVLERSDWVLQSIRSELLRGKQKKTPRE